jgi:hypothetical protein
MDAPPHHVAVAIIGVGIAIDVVGIVVGIVGIIIIVVAVIRVGSEAKYANKSAAVMKPVVEAAAVETVTLKSTASDSG